MSWVIDQVKQTIVDPMREKIDSVRGTDLEKRVKEATSNENWAASYVDCFVCLSVSLSCLLSVCIPIYSNTMKNEIARATMDYGKFNEIMSVLWTRMQESPSNWRIVFKESHNQMLASFYRFFTSHFLPVSCRWLCLFVALSVSSTSGISGSLWC